MKTILLSLIMILSPLGTQVSFAWNEARGDHFILYYQGDDRTFPDRVLRKAESYYDTIAGALGFPRRSQFWLWDDRCKIYLHETKDAFHTETKQATWSNGFAVPSKRRIVSYQGSEQFLDSILPHEIAHLIFKDFTGARNGSIPLWLEEGLAMAQERAKREEFDRLVERMISEKKWIPIETMSKIRSLGGASQQEAALFYAQAQSLVRFLLASADSSRFAGLCRELRDGASLEVALRKNYAHVFPTMEVFEQKWVAART